MKSRLRKALLGVSASVLIAAAVYGNSADSADSLIDKSFCSGIELCNQPDERLNELVLSLDSLIAADYDKPYSSSNAATGVDRVGIDSVLDSRTGKERMADAVQNNIASIGISDHYNSDEFRKSLEQIGIVFHERPSFIDGMGGRSSYELGKIISKYEEPSTGATIIHYRNDDFSYPLEFMKARVTVPMWKLDDRIYVNHSAIEHDGDRFFGACQSGQASQNNNQDTSSKFLLKEFHRLGGHKRDKSGFIEAYKRNFIDSYMEHERSHIRRAIPDRAESEAMAFLDQLHKAPSYLVFSNLYSYSISEDYIKAAGIVLSLFEGQGFDKNRLLVSDLSTISNASGRIISQRYGF